MSLNNITGSDTKNSPLDHPINDYKKSISHKINSLSFVDERASKLANHFFTKKFLWRSPDFFRKRQSYALKNLIRDLNQGGNGGLIKLPTGSGKTFLFGNVIQALQTPSIILVPRENHVEKTYEELVGNEKKVGLGFLPAQTHMIFGGQTGTAKEQAENILNQGSFNGILIITYQSFVSLNKGAPELFQRLIANVGCIVSDEAHRALGDKTSQVIDDAKDIIEKNSDDNEDEDDFLEDDISLEDENASQEIIQKLIEKTKLVHIHTTATPQLSLKKVDEKIIYASTFGEGVIDGTLILPQQPYIGSAYTQTAEEKITQKENKKGLDTYLLEDGTPVYEALTLQYMDQKDKNGGYLPSVAFCNTTQQVEAYVQYLHEQGIKAIQCTTNTQGTHYCDVKTAEQKLESAEADIIVTCSKVGEGWDLPTLRGALWLVPSSSPARIMQGTGRITRTLSDIDTKRIMDLTGLPREYIEKSSRNTILFSPNKWNYTYAVSEHAGDGSKKRDSKDDTPPSQRPKTIGFTLGGLELYGKYGELTLDQITSLGLDIDGIKIHISKKELFEILWNYKGRSTQESYNHFMGLTAPEIKTLNIGGNAVRVLKKLSGIEVEGNIYTPTVFQTWITLVFAGKDVLTLKDQLFQTLWNYEERSTQESYNHFMGLSQPEILKLNIGGNAVTALKKLSEIEVKGNMYTLTVFQNWINEVFEGKDIKFQETLTKDLLFQTIWNYKGRTTQESYNHFMGLSQSEILKLKIGGKAVTALQTLSGIEVEGDMYNSTVFQTWITLVFAGKDVLTIKDQLFQTLWNYEGRTTQESYNHFMGLNREGILDLRIGGNKVMELKNLSEIEVKGSIYTLTVFQTWITLVFSGKNIDFQKKLTKDQLFQKLWNYEGRTTQESYDHFMGLTIPEIGELNIGGNAIGALKTLSEIEVDGNIYKLKVFQTWINLVFAGKDILTLKDQLFQKLWNYEGRTTQESYDHFMGLTAPVINKLNIGGKAIGTLKTLSGIKVEGNIHNPTVFKNWIKQVFAEKDINFQEKLTKDQLFQKLWNYEGRSAQESYDHFMGLTAPVINKLNIGGKAIAALKTLSGIKVEGNIHNPTVFKNWIKQVFAEKDIVRN